MFGLTLACLGMLALIVNDCSGQTLWVDPSGNTFTTYHTCAGGPQAWRCWYNTSPHIRGCCFSGTYSSAECCVKCPMGADLEHRCNLNSHERCCPITHGYSTCCNSAGWLAYLRSSSRSSWLSSSSRSSLSSSMSSSLSNWIAYSSSRYWSSDCSTKTTSLSRSCSSVLSDYSTNSYSSSLSQSRSYASVCSRSSYYWSSIFSSRSYYSSRSQSRSCSSVLSDYSSRSYSSSLSQSRSYASVCSRSSRYWSDYFSTSCQWSRVIVKANCSSTGGSTGGSTGVTNGGSTGGSTSKSNGNSTVGAMSGGHIIGSSCPPETPCSNTGLIVGGTLAGFFFLVLVVVAAVMGSQLAAHRSQSGSPKSSRPISGFENVIYDRSTDDGVTVGARQEEQMNFYAELQLPQNGQPKY